MKRSLYFLFFLILVTSLIVGCSTQKVTSKMYYIEENGKKDYLDEENKDVVELLALIEAYEKVENDYDYRTVDKTARYPYVTERYKNFKETGRWEEDIKCGKICMKWCNFEMNYIKFDESLQEAEADYLTCFTVKECGCLEERGFEDGATYQAPITLQAKKEDGKWKVDDYTFTSKNAKKIKN
ncbi:MAG TPA: hypothetical protein GXZ78_04395 [Eubacteriaceae bacterium]|nr:hypothetical protein [Eubacteriaceae bacterium]